MEYVQRWDLIFADLVKLDPGRARQNRTARARRNFTKPCTKNKSHLCTYQKFRYAHLEGTEENVQKSWVGRRGVCLALRAMYEWRLQEVFIIFVIFYPLPLCLDFGAIYSTEFMQPPLLHLLLEYLPPPSADVICAWPLSKAAAKLLFTQWCTTLVSNRLNLLIAFEQKQLNHHMTVMTERDCCGTWRVKSVSATTEGFCKKHGSCKNRIPLVK